METEQAIREGRYFERIEGKKHTLKEAIERYLSEYPCDGMRRCHFKRWRGRIGETVLADISPVLINDIIKLWKEEPNDRGEIRQGSTLNRHITSLSCVFTAAVRDWGWTSKNPVRDVRRQKEPKGRIRFLSDEEREKLLTACKESDCPYLYLVVVLALSTGMRKAEILNLKWSEVDLTRGAIVLYKTKNKEPRRVAIRGLALELLKKHSAVRRLDTELLFPGELSPKNGRPFDIRKAWEAARGKAKLENFVFHDLRHSCASYLAMGGATLLEIAEVLGHKTLDMVRRYAHLAESHTAGVVERMNQRIFRGS